MKNKIVTISTLFVFGAHEMHAEETEKKEPHTHSESHDAVPHSNLPAQIASGVASGGSAATGMQVKMIIRK